MILDHASRPRHFGTLADADHSAIAENPTCGDRFHVFVKLDGSTIASIQFLGRGCSISMASASMMAQALQRTSLVEARLIGDRFKQLLSEPLPGSTHGSLGDLDAFATLRSNPIRTRCATLPWTALRSALIDLIEGD